jgi:hypothetical protein
MKKKFHEAEKKRKQENKEKKQKFQELMNNNRFVPADSDEISDRKIPTYPKENASFDTEFLSKMVLSMQYQKAKPKPSDYLDAFDYIKEKRFGLNFFLVVCLFHCLISWRLKKEM